MILVFGEILFDVFPWGKRLGGAPFNFAYHLKKMGLDVRFVSRVSLDSNGIDILDFLDKNNFHIDDIQIDPSSRTGTVNVLESDNGEHFFEIEKNTAYDNLEYSERVRSLINKKPDLIYFGTLQQRTEKGSDTVHRILNEASGKSRLFCDLNLRQDFYSKEIIKSSLLFSDLLKLNCEELDIILKMLFEDNKENPSALLNEYNISDIIITKGKHGSTWTTRDKNEEYQNAGKIIIEDTVGAGDAFAAVAAAGYLQKLPVKKIIKLAGGFASHICTVKGALPETDSYYDYLKKEMELNNE